MRLTENRGPCCDVCGIPWSMREVTINSDHRGTTAYCKLCSGLLDAGLIRFDGNDEDGTPRFRQWNMEWKEGRRLARPYDG